MKDEFDGAIVDVVKVSGRNGRGCLFGTGHKPVAAQDHAPDLERADETMPVLKAVGGSRMR